MSKPLVSIIIPVYNGANYLQQAIDSALSQSYPNCEVIVINDGSIDEGKTEGIAKRYVDHIRYYSKENGGVSSALNLGVQVMNGEYFSWLSHDDVYLPNKIESQITQIEKLNGQNILSLCGHRLVDKSLYPLKRKTFINLPSDTVISGEDALMYMFRRGTYNGCALLIPKVAFDCCGGFDENLRFNQDSFMWYKIFLAGFKMSYIPEVGVYQRTHYEQATQHGQSTFLRDCLYMNEYLISRIQNNRELFYLYTMYNAKYNVVNVVSECFKVNKSHGLLRKGERLRIRFYMLYGSIRPLIKRLYYYLVFHKPFGPKEVNK